MFKSFIMIIAIVLLVGCANSPKTVLGKESESYNKSPCANCRAKPFYVNGQWLS